MGLRTRLLVASFSLFLSVPAAWADTGAAAASTQQGSMQAAKHRPRMSHRALWHRRHIAVSSPRAVGPIPSPTDELANGSGANAHVKKSEAPPAQVLIEAMMIQVKLKADADATATDAGNLQLRWIQGSSTEFVRNLESMGETTVLAAPRLLVLDKQRAEIHLGDRLGYRTKTANQTDETHYVDIGTKLRLRPFVSADGTTRLEIHAERTTGHLDDNGAAQTNTCAFTANVMMQDGKTVALGGPVQAAPASDDLSVLRWLPYIGWLFPNTDNVAAKQQLILLITSRVWSPDAAAVARSTSKIVR